MLGAVSFSHDGARIISTTREAVQVWNAATGRELISLPGVFLGPASFSRDGATLVAPGEGVRVWDVARLTQPMDELARAACAQFFGPAGRQFTTDEIGADEGLIRAVWLQRRHTRDVCEDLASPHSNPTKMPSALHPPRE
jgi:hypothetical protein